MTPWTPTPGPIAHHGRHRRPALHVDPLRIEAQYDADVARHLADGRTVDEAQALAGQDADARLLGWQVAS